ncbi:MAG: PadR family transcriptional regulator [Mycetocola sp.]
MSVRLAILALLDRGPGYGYQLKQELHQRVGGWDVNVGQIYNTLERLVRDGLARRAGESDGGQVLYSATAPGRDHTAQWWVTPCRTDRHGTEERLVKVALAVSLPGVDARAVVRCEREALVGADADMTVGAGAGADVGAGKVADAGAGADAGARADGDASAVTGSGSDAASGSVADLAERATRRSQLDWLDAVETGLAAGTLAEHPLDREPGRRGRPGRTTEPSQRR